MKYIKAVRFLKKNNKLTILITIFIFILLMFVVLTVFPIKEELFLDSILQKPSMKHIFGTDFLGRDIFIRTLIGFKNTFIVAFIIQIITFIMGGFIGAFLGYYANIADEILFHVFNFLLSFPSILAAIFLSTFMGRGILTVIIIFSIFGTIYNIKLVRAEINSIKSSDFVVALRINGITERRIFLSHMLPRAYIILSPLIPMLVGHTMLGISSFSFLGLGYQAPTAELGIILKDGLRFANNGAYLFLLPGLFQFFNIFMFTLLTDELEIKMQRRIYGEGIG